MIADALRVEIERYAVQMRTQNPLFFKAENGSLTASCIARYLANVKFLICEAQICLARASELARASGDAPLALHYESKRIEEKGHDVWADRDIERISGVVMTAKPNHDVVPAAHAFVGYLVKTIDEDPSLYLAYLLFAEYLTVLLGDEWLKLVEERCGIPRTSMTVIGNHVDLDREHVEEALDCIDALVSDPKKLPRFRQVLLENIVHFQSFCSEATDEKRFPHDDTRSSESSKHISAA